MNLWQFAKINNKLYTYWGQKVPDLQYFSCIVMQILVAMGGHFEFWITLTSCGDTGISIQSINLDLLGIYIINAHMW